MPFPFLSIAVALTGALLPVAPRAAGEAEICGRREVLDGQEVLFLWGTAAERGHAEGYLYASEILSLFSGFCLDPALLPDPKLWDVLLLPAVRQRVEFRPETRERAEGMIRGIAARLTEEERRVPELGRELGALDLLAGLAQPDLGGFLGCSSFAACCELLEEGEGPLVGRNLDYFSTPRLLEQCIVKVEAARDGSAAWVSLGYPGLPGCLTGISAERVFVAVHDVPARSRGNEKVMPRLDALGALVEGLEPGPEPAQRAAELLRQYHFCFGGNAMLAWNFPGGAGGAVLELDPDRDREEGVSIRDPGHFPFVVCSNHHRLRSAAEDCWRYETLESGCAAVADLAAEPLDLERAWALLCKASKNDTIYRCVVDLEHLRLRLQRRGVPGGEMMDPVDLDLEALLQRCEEYTRVAQVTK